MVGYMKTTLRGLSPIAAFSAALTALLVAIGIVVPLLGIHDLGVRLDLREDGRVIVQEVYLDSLATESGVEPGMIVTSIGSRALVQLPQITYATPDQSADPNAAPTPIGIEPATPKPLITDRGALLQLIAQPVRSLEVADERGYVSPDGRRIGFGSDFSGAQALLYTVTGLAVLVFLLWWFLSRRGARDLQSIGLPLALAVSAPFLLRGLAGTWSPVALGLHGILLTAAMAPLGFALATQRGAASGGRRLALLGFGLAAVGAVVVGAARPFMTPWDWPEFAFMLLLAGIPAVPTFLATGFGGETGRIDDRVPAGSGPTGSGFVRSAETLALGITPAIAVGSVLATRDSSLVWLLLAWGLIVYAAGRFTVRPLARLVNRTTVQRDLVVAATEAERARVAADIHDDALQELTLLVRRLDAAGDAEGAEIARGVSDRLRAICGDLRLPILDDLGVGPALDWLVLRFERLAGGEVRLERADGSRLPSNVELAFFRIAQEALSNAVRHGKAPIVVRFRSSEAGASLSIDDSGDGIAADAADQAERDGRFGLLNMAQRAEGIGAILDIRRWPTGGTHVGLEWRPR